MDPSRGSRFLDPAVAALSKHKAEAIKLAREQGVAVREMCRRAKTNTPPYEFEELIGKGSYGRVYKGHQLPSSKVVAIKVMDIDSVDYQTVRDFRDESIKDFIHEIRVMKQVKDAGARNINELIEAISIHSQLWLVCEYCPGGSVRTLVRAFLLPFSAFVSIFSICVLMSFYCRCERPATGLRKSLSSLSLESLLLGYAPFMMPASSTEILKVGNYLKATGLATDLLKLPIS